MIDLSLVPLFRLLWDCCQALGWGKKRLSHGSGKNLYSEGMQCQFCSFHFLFVQLLCACLFSVSFLTLASGVGRNISVQYFFDFFCIIFYCPHFSLLICTKPKKNSWFWLFYEWQIHHKLHHLIDILH